MHCTGLQEAWHTPEMLTATAQDNGETCENIAHAELAAHAGVATLAASFADT